MRRVLIIYLVSHGVRGSYKSATVDYRIQLRVARLAAILDLLNIRC